MASPAVVGQHLARLPFPVGDGGANPTPRLHFTTASVAEVNWLLSAAHYLGTAKGGRYAYAGWVDDVMVAAMVYRHPTARYLPSDGTMLELSRWCLTPDAGRNAGSRMMRWARHQILKTDPVVTTLVSYSDPSVGHDGALYRASGWHWAPTWHRLSPPPTGNGSWNGVTTQSVKDRWFYVLRGSTVDAMPDEAESTYDPHEGHPVVSPEIAVDQDEVSTGPQPEPDPENPAKDGPPKE